MRWRKREPQGAAALVARLVEGPGWLSELEAIVGPIRMSFRSEDNENMGFLSRPAIGAAGEFSSLIPRLSVRYAWDSHHEEPTRPRDVRLLEYTLHLRGDRAAVERVLLDRFGKPVVVDGPGAGATAAAAAYTSFHPFYVVDSAVTDVALTWFATVPAFAIPVPDLDARRRWLTDLAAHLATAGTVDEIDSFCRTAPAEVGIEVHGSRNQGLNPYAEFDFPLADTRDCSLALAPPVPALVLADAFGWAPAVGVSHDVHMSSWHLERRGAGWLPITGALQHWEVVARLVRMPSGPPDPEPARGPSRPLTVAEDDEVADLTIRPRFR